MSDAPVSGATRAYIVRGLPRRVLPDLAWLGGCSNSAGWPGPAALRRPITHEPCVAYLILGAAKTVLLDTGHFAHWYALQGQLEDMLQGRSLDYVFVSHQEIPHTGNLGRLLRKYPAAKAVGVSDPTRGAWMKKFAPPITECCPAATIDELRDENKRLKAALKRAELEREILKKRRRSSRGSRREARLDSSPSRHLSRHGHVPGARRVDVGLLRGVW